MGLTPTPPTSHPRLDVWLLVLGGLLLTLAAAQVGAVCMPVNWRLAPSEVRYIVDHGGARLMVADRAFLPLVDRAGMPALQQVLVTDGACDGLPGLHDWADSAPDDFAPAAVRPEDPLLQLYSSGTTGLRAPRRRARAWRPKIRCGGCAGRRCWRWRCAPRWRPLRRSARPWAIRSGGFATPRCRRSGPSGTLIPRSARAS